MIQQQRSSRFKKAIRGLVAASFAVSFFSAMARAQQVYIQSLWASGNALGNCGYDAVGGNFVCDGPPNAINPAQGNISNNPHIEFDNIYSIPLGCPGSSFPQGSNSANYCNAGVYLCAQIGYNNSGTTSASSSFALDSLNFEIFQFGNGTNGLDPASSPPLRTFYINHPGDVPGAAAGVSNPGTLPSNGTCGNGGRPPGCGYCVLWDGSFNILGGFGKSNGQFGFRSTVATNQTNSTNGNINISNTAMYPFGTTRDSNLTVVSQKPVSIDVVDVHVVRSTPTIVGATTGVAAEPYNITYRLSKDATTYIAITDSTNHVVRVISPGLQGVGEGTPLGTLQNGTSWNGRADNGDFVLPSNYRVFLQAEGVDSFGNDLSIPTTIQISLDPLQITDIAVQPLLGASTALAGLTYTLTEPATTYIDIFPPGTQFCNTLNNLNGLIPDQAGPSPKDFAASLTGCPVAPINKIQPVRRYAVVQNSRVPVTIPWDGADESGKMLADGDYEFLLYASLPSQNGTKYLNNPLDSRIWTSVAKTGFLTIARGYVSVSQILPISTVIGSSPAVAGLDPFMFNYTLSREAYVNLNILDSTGVTVKRTLLTQAQRFGNIVNSEVWNDVTDDNGLVLSSGTYLAQLSATDPIYPTKVTTTTAIFPINLFRITDVSNTPLLTLATSEVTLSYQLSQSMFVSWNIYPPGTIVKTSSGWPPCGTLTPGICAQTTDPAGHPIAPLASIYGMRPRRAKITEHWNGRDQSGLFVQDGTYVFTLVAQSTTTPQYFATDVELGYVTVARGSPVFTSFTINSTLPTLYNSSQTVELPPYEISYAISRQSSVTIQILNTNVPPVSMRTLLSGTVRDGGVLVHDYWDGKDNNGNFVPRGIYIVQATAYDLASQLSSGTTIQQMLAVDPLRIYDVAVTPLVHGGGAAIISYQVSEPMKTSLKIYNPGTFIGVNGNATPPDPVSLVRFFTGIDPARTLINRQWDGRNIQLALVPDGDYIFRLVGSTASAQIDSLTANVLPGASLADDLITADISVSRGSSTDPQGDFETNSFVYPNPVSGSQATINVWAPFQADVSVKMFNLAGVLVYEKFYPNQPNSYEAGPLMIPWSRVNSSNRRLAPGVYFLLIRENDTKGGTNVLQTVKKILLQ